MVEIHARSYPLKDDWSTLALPLPTSSNLEPNNNFFILSQMKRTVTLEFDEI